MNPTGTDFRLRYRLRRARLDEATTPAPETAAPAAAPAAAENQDFVLLQQRSNQLKQENNQLKDAVVRARADYDNLKRRTNIERQQFKEQGKEEVMIKLLDVLDNFDRAVEAAQNHDEIGPIRDGILMVQSLMRRALGEEGLRRIEAVGQEFDPNLHEAISRQDRNDVPDNSVTVMMAAGYQLGEKVIRPAKVVVAKHPA